METLIAGRYEVISKLGQGGMGTVFKVRHIELDEVRALKLLPHQLADDTGGVTRFREEARQQHLLRHENIIWVSDFGRDRDQYYIVMDYIEGPNLAQHLKTRGRLRVHDALEIARQVASALAYAHARGVVHRDVKPSNVLLASLSPPRALLFDFGIAKVEAASERTSTGMMLGSPAYSSPEQYGYRRGKVKVPISPRTDVFSLGLVLYEMCEGRKFFADLEPVEIMAKLAYEPAPLVPDLSRDVPRPVHDLIARAIRRDPDERYASMAEMLAAIETCLRAVPEEEEEDKDKTVLLRSPDDTVAGRPAEDTDDELEQRIRALEREKQRRLAQSARAKLERLREEAQAAKAHEVVPTLFGQGTTQEEAAGAALEQSQYLKARELFDAAAESFAGAASAAQAQRSERAAAEAREAALEAKGAAERVGAPDASPTVFTRAAGRAADAEEAFERRAYDDAQKGYAEAERLFGEAVQVARSKRQEAAGLARGRAEEARASAEEAGAPDAARTVYGRAVDLIAKGEAGVGRGAFDEAERAYGQAVPLFAEAEQRAREARSEAAERAGAEARKAKQAAEAVGAPETVRSQFERAVQRVVEAEKALERSAHAEAERAYADAARLFGEAEHAAREARARTAERARADAFKAKRAAEDAGAAEGAPAELERAVQRVTEAEAALERAAHGEAESAYVDAARLFGEAAKAARAIRQGAAERAREASQGAREQALASGAAERSPAALRAARQHESQADKALEAGDPVGAEESFSAAARAYLAAAEEATRRQWAERSDAARDEAKRAQAEAREEGADSERSPVYVSAAKRFAAAEELTGRGLYEKAIGGFQEATALFAEAAQAGRDAKEAALEETRTGYLPTDEGDRTVVVDSDRTHVLETERTVVVPMSKEPRATRVPDIERIPVEAEEEAEEEELAPVAPPIRARPAYPVYAGAAALLIVVAAVGMYLLRRPPTVPETVAPPTSAAPVRPFDWEQTSPPGTELTARAGQTVHFQVAVRDAATRSDLRYAWTLDGKRGKDGAAWDYTPGREEVGRQHDVQVTASSGGREIQQRWRLQVSAGRPPIVVKSVPSDNVVELGEGAEQAFSIEATDPDASEGGQLTYVWQRNGDIVASGRQASWTLREARPNDEVRVTVRGSTGVDAEPRSWRIAALPPTQPLAPTVNHPPKIVGTTPVASKPVTVEEGDTEEFSVRAEDPDKDDRLAYLWLIDGREAGRAKALQFTAPSTAAPKAPHRLEVEVSDLAGLKAPRVAWDVEVMWARPKIVDWQPTERDVTVEAGKSLEFQAKAKTRTGGGEVQYEWKLDGDVQVNGPGRFQVPAALRAGSHLVEVASIDTRGARGEPRRWTLAVKPPATPAPDRGLTDQDAQDWLARYKTAWESRDAAAVKALGIIDAGQEATLQDRLDKYKRLQLAISNVSLKVEADRFHGTVSFDRSDTDETGRTNASPRQSCRIEKGLHGVQGTGRCAAER